MSRVGPESINTTRPQIHAEKGGFEVQLHLKFL